MKKKLNKTVKTLLVCNIDILKGCKTDSHLTLYGKIGGFVEEPFFNDRIHIPYPQNVV